ncbi:MAG: ATP-binding protein [Robiginitomaculum sp.]
MNKESLENTKMSRRTIVLLSGLAALVIVTTIVASLQGRSLGWSAFILLIGVFVVSMLSIVTILFSNGKTGYSQENSADAEKFLEASFQNLSIPSLIVQNTKPVLANTAYLDLARTLGAELMGEEAPSVARLFSKNEKNASAALFRLHHTSMDNAHGREDISILLPDGSYKVFTVDVHAIPNGQLWQISIGDEKVASEKSSLSEVPLGLFSMSLGGSVLEMNTTLKGWLGHDDAGFPENIINFIESPDILLKSKQVPGRVIRANTRLITQKGVVSPTALSAIWHQLDSGDMCASVALQGHVGIGASSRPRVRSSEDKTDFYMFNEAPFGVVLLDSWDLKTAKVVNANAAIVEMFDVRNIIGGNFKSLFSESTSASKFLAAHVENKDEPHEVRLSDTKKRPVNVYSNAHANGSCTAFIVDITARKSLEDQLVQSQKMQAIGQLAGGVAHDFNNLLTAIRLNTDELLGRHPVGDPSYPELQKINQTVSRAAGLVRKLLAFSRKQTLRAEVLDVTDTLSDLSVLLNQVLVDRVKLDVVHGRGLPPIRADKTQLETVLMNLCVNARDASVDAGGGTITLRSVKVSDDDLERDSIKVPKGGGFVLIEVTDTGTGMDLETQEKIFEPFFTTKKLGKGTGLGLATVYGIVEQSGGHLRLQSEIGVGTTFRVYIPTASKADIIEFKPKPKPMVVKPKDLAGQGHILFVEDEDAVRTIAAKTLRKRGYTVTEACDGEEAYEILKEASENFDLMISDVVMPGMDGPTLLKKGRKLLGKAEVVFISGYAEEEFSDLLAEEPDVTFLPKPFTLKELAEKVKSVIGEAA